MAVASISAAAKENDEYEDYPKAAIAVTVIKAHIIYLSPHIKFSQSASQCGCDLDSIFSFVWQVGANPSATYYVRAKPTVTSLALAI